MGVSVVKSVKGAMVRALWLVRRDLEQHRGGDTTQILSTAEALRRRGVQVDLASERPADLRTYDIFHLFHLDRVWENVEHARRLRAAGRPLVLSTIYWPSDEFDRGGRVGLQGRLARLVGSNAYQNLRVLQRHLLATIEGRRPPHFSRAWFSFRRGVHELLAAAAVLLPNSRAEQAQIERQFEIMRPVVIVPNAADTATFGPPNEPAPRRDGVLCVGRIEPRKNQLALIEALRGTGIPLTLVGRSGRFYQQYYARCQEAAGAHVRFLDAQPPAALRELYHRARVHACVSWYETPGLVSLEAALCGCALVVTPGGCTREYFGDAAHYARPEDPDFIRAAVQTALAQGPQPELVERVRREFTWAAAAAQTEQGYRRAMGGE